MDPDIPVAAATLVTVVTPLPAPGRPGLTRSDRTSRLVLPSAKSIYRLKDNEIKQLQEQGFTEGM